MKDVTPLDRLLSLRRECVSRIENIDTELSRRGVRVDAHPNPIPRTVALSVIEAMADGKPHDGRAVAKATGQGVHACQQMLHKLTKAGELQRVERGVYALAGKVTS